MSAREETRGLIFDLREFTSVNAPYPFKVVIGVKKGGSVVVDDLELEVDDD